LGKLECVVGERNDFVFDTFLNLVVKFRMDYGSGNGGGSFEVDKGTDAAYVTDVIKTVLREGRDLGDERVVGVKKKPRLLAVEEGRIEVEERKREGLGI
jgi:hypothetical protein